MATRGIFLVKTSPQVESTAEQINDKSKYSALFTVRDKLIEKFDGDIDDNKLLVGAIKGMTNSLGDEYTVFKTPEEFDKLMKESNSSMTGIGVTVTLKDSKVVIIETVKGAPADRAGLVENDIIEKVNDVDILDDYEKAIAMIAEANNSEIKLTIKRADADEFDVTVVRENVKINAVDGSMINSTIGYIRIKTFMNENTTEDFKATIEELKAQGMKGIILDLRENPGGLLTEARSGRSTSSAPRRRRCCSTRWTGCSRPDASLRVRAPDPPRRCHRPAGHARAGGAHPGRRHGPDHPAARWLGRATGRRRHQGDRGAGSRDHGRGRAPAHRGRDGHDRHRRGSPESGATTRPSPRRRPSSGRSRSGTGPRSPATSATPRRPRTPRRRCWWMAPSWSRRGQPVSVGSPSMASSCDPASRRWVVTRSSARSNCRRRPCVAGPSTSAGPGDAATISRRSR